MVQYLHFRILKLPLHAPSHASGTGTTSYAAARRRRPTALTLTATRRGAPRAAGRAPRRGPRTSSSMPTCRGGQRWVDAALSWDIASAGKSPCYSWDNSRFQWPSSRAKLNYQRVASVTVVFETVKLFQSA